MADREPQPTPPSRPGRPATDHQPSGFSAAMRSVVLVGVFGIVAWLVLTSGALSSVGVVSVGVVPGPAPTPDVFAGVRAEAQAAYERGARHFQRKEYDLALIELDQARLNDPDNRADIAALLNTTLAELGQGEPQVVPTSTPELAQPTSTPFTVAVPPALPKASPAVNATPGPLASPAENSASAVVARFQTFEDVEKRFTVDFPVEWQQVERPEAEAGVGVVGFKPAGGRATFVASVDGQRQTVSPELYAAHLETQMSTLPGYKLETASPFLLNGAPALRRRFTLQRPGEPEKFTTAQVVVGRRSWMFILTASAPSGEFARTDAIFNRMISSFRITA